MRGLWLRMRRLFRSGESEREIDEELRFHVEMETDALVRQGVDRREARHRALVAFGGEDRFREETRGARATGWLEDGLRDARYAARALRHSPGFALSALATLALGIGATAGVYGVVRGVVLAPLPYPEPEELVTVWMSNPAQGIEEDITSWPNFVD
jgi:putative ABC transport system permease protein